MGLVGCPFDRAAIAREIVRIEFAHESYSSLHAHKIALGRARNLFTAVQLDGSVHPTWTLNGTSSGRWTSRDPSLQNLTIQLKQCMQNVASIDVSNMELYVAAVLAGERRITTPYEAGADLHTRAAYRLEIDRKTAKVFNLSTLLGAMPYGVAKRLNIEERKAARIISQWWDLYPALEELRGQIIEGVELQDGLVVTELLQHETWVDLSEENWKNKAFAHYIQGTAADLMKLAVSRMTLEGVELYGVLHDEVLVHPKDTSKATKAIEGAHEDYKLRTNALVINKE